MKRKAIYTTKHEKLEVPVTVIDKRKVFGRHEYRLEKFDGELWVTAAKVKFLED